MPFDDSPKREQPASAQEADPKQEERPVADAEEIETPIEAGVQAQAQHEFETERKIPKSCKKAIVSVNGRDVDEVPMPAHDRAA
jgi:hypothetical protein